MGISLETVRQIELRALRKIRESVETMREYLA
jgi:DNA-directed RNA polymerase sigma subunit (sigma70/sigma32)